MMEEDSGYLEVCIEANSSLASIPIMVDITTRDAQAIGKA